MADDLSLLFRLKADASQMKQATAEARAAVNQLKQSFGPELTQTVTVANKAFSDIASNLNVFVGQRIPLVGGAFVRVTENLRNFTTEGSKVEKTLAKVGQSMQSIASQSNRTVPEIARFLTGFTQLGTQAERDTSAIQFFGATLGTKLIPELEETGTAMAGLSTETAAAGSAIAGLAIPVTIAVAAVVALVGGLVLVSKELFETSKAAAEFQGRMRDLSQQTGVAVETLSALEIAAATTGGNLTTITQTLVQFQRKLDESLDPLSKTAAKFKDLGIEATDTETAFRQAFTSLAAMPEGFRQTNAAAELFGSRGGKQVLAILKETGGDIDALIAKARELSILIDGDAARSADHFNDELTLLNFEMRSLKATVAQDLIPLFTELVHNFGELVRASRPLLSIIGTLAGPVVKQAADSLRGLSLVVQFLTNDYEGLARSIKEVNEEEAKRRDIPALTTEGPQPVGRPAQPSKQQQVTEAARLADDLVAITKRRVADEAQILNEAFERGRVTREQQAAETIRLNQQELVAEKARIDAAIAAQDERFRLIARERLSRQEIVDAEQAVNQQVSKLQQERLDKEAEFERTSEALRAKARQERANSERNEAANTADRLASEFDNQIKQVQAGIDRGVVVEAEGLTQIEQLERAKIETRIESLQEQKRIGFLTVEAQRDLDKQIQQAQQEADHLDQEQQRRRLARDLATAQRSRDIKLSEIDTLLQLESLRAERLIAANEALADARLQSEEQAARKILTLRLGLIDDEIEATRAKLAATKTITDTDERVRAEAELNSQLKLLNEQRLTIQSDGNRAIDDARQKDIDSARRYANDLRQIGEDIVEIQLDTAREVIRLMQNHFASRKGIIRAQRELDIAEEAARHQRALDSITSQTREVDKQIRLLESHIKALKIGTTEEIEQYERLIEELEKLRAKRAGLDAEEQAEAQRHKTRGKGIDSDTERAIREREGIFVPGDLLPDVQKGADVVKSVTEGLRSAFTELKHIGLDAFSGLAQGIGSLVQNYVLLGTTGPAALRKLLAATLAQVAAESAVKAIYWTAQGIVDLFFNPARAAADFAGAALFASIAGVSALAGRAVAGNLFQPTTGGDAAGAGRGGSSDTRDNKPNPIDLTRQPQAINVNIIVHGEPGPGFGQEVIRTVIHDVSINGPTRDAMVKTAGG